MNKKLLDFAQRCTSIQDVYMRDSQVQLDAEYDPTFFGGSLSVQHKLEPLQSFVIEAQESENGNKFRILKVHILTGMRLIDGNLTSDDLSDPEKVLPHVKAEISATFVAVYLITCDDLSQEAIDVFSKQNAGFHVWPYWREYLQSTCNRSRLPAFVMPMYRIPQDESSTQEVSSTK